ncbi:MAG: FG-GAP repeat protein, partial [Gemmatimonadota bacterium]|nr:FG-GAP repeat protein [Gemmatimonadota bacterium]
RHDRCRSGRRCVPHAVGECSDGGYHDPVGSVHDPRQTTCRQRPAGSPYNIVGATEVATGDIDGDGVTEVVVGPWDGDEITVFTGKTLAMRKLRACERPSDSQSLTLMETDVVRSLQRAPPRIAS